MPEAIGPHDLLALRHLAQPAGQAVAATDRPGKNHLIPGTEVPDFPPDLDDLTDRLVPDAIPGRIRPRDLGGSRIVAVINVQVAAADSAAGDPHQHVARVAQFRILVLLVAD